MHNANPFHLGGGNQLAANVSFGGNFLGGTQAVNQLGVASEEESNHERKKNANIANGPDGIDLVMKDEEDAMHAWKLHLQKNKSVIVDLFQGQLKSTVECLVCKNRSTKFDCLMYLSVPIAHR